ncbi:hypothetical protein ES702_02240 [subsurface metagenome]
MQCLRDIISGAGISDLIIKPIKSCQGDLFTAFLEFNVKYVPITLKSEFYKSKI